MKILNIEYLYEQSDHDQNNKGDYSCEGQVCEYYSYVREIQIEDKDFENFELNNENIFNNIVYPRICHENNNRWESGNWMNNKCELSNECEDNGFGRHDFRIKILSWNCKEV